MMPVKNSPNVQDNKETKKKSSRLITTLSATAMTIASILSINDNDSFGQIRKQIIDFKQKNITESMDNIDTPSIKKNNIKSDSIDYNHFSRTPIDLIFSRYGKEKTQEIVRQSLLREINKTRKENGAEHLELEDHLTQAAQLYSEQMFKDKRFNHIAKNWDNWVKRAKKAGYTWTLESVDEDIWWNYYSIEDAMKERKNSKPHFKAMINPQQIDLWVWYYNGYRVLMFGK